ncbi:hypothetical protein Tco_0973062 [Tanacetum coccineum]
MSSSEGSGIQYRKTTAILSSDNRLVRKQNKNLKLYRKSIRRIHTPGYAVSIPVRNPDYGSEVEYAVFV